MSEVLIKETSLVEKDFIFYRENKQLNYDKGDYRINS